MPVRHVLPDGCPLAVAAALSRMCWPRLGENWGPPLGLLHGLSLAPTPPPPHPALRPAQGAALVSLDPRPYHLLQGHLGLCPAPRPFRAGNFL